MADNLTESMKRKLRRDTGEHLISAKSNVYRDFQMVKKAYDSSLDRLFRLDMPDPVQMLYFKLGNDAVLKAAIEDRDQQIVLWSLKNWMVKVDDTEPEHRWRMMKRLLYNLSLIFLQNSISSQEICNLYQSIREGDCESVKKQSFPLSSLNFWHPITQTAGMPICVRQRPNISAGIIRKKSRLTNWRNSSIYRLITWERYLRRIWAWESKNTRQPYVWNRRRH